jgi:hypothetical protein
MDRAEIRPIRGESNLVVIRPEVRRSRYLHLREDSVVVETVTIEGKVVTRRLPGNS